MRKIQLHTYSVHTYTNPIQYQGSSIQRMKVAHQGYMYAQKGRGRVRKMVETG